MAAAAGTGPSSRGQRAARIARARRACWFGCRRGGRAGPAAPGESVTQPGSGAHFRPAGSLLADVPASGPGADPAAGCSRGIERGEPIPSPRRPLAVAGPVARRRHIRVLAVPITVPAELEIDAHPVLQRVRKPRPDLHEVAVERRNKLSPRAQLVAALRAYARPIEDRLALWALLRLRLVGCSAWGRLDRHAPAER